MKPPVLVVAVFCVVLGIAVGIALHPLASSGQHQGPVAVWLEVAHRVGTAVGGVGSFVALIVVLRQFYLLRAQSELVQKNVRASTDALYARLDSFNRFVFEHSTEYDLLDTPYHQLDSPGQRSKLHRMCELGFTFFEEIYKHHLRLKLLETEDWEKWEQNLLHFFQKPYVRGYWCTVACRYTRSFQALANELVAKLGAGS